MKKMRAFIEEYSFDDQYVIYKSKSGKGASGAGFGSATASVVK